MTGFWAKIGVCIVALILGCASPASAASGIEWPSFANRIISTVAKTRDLQTPAAAIAFAQDRVGFLWAGGESGLLRWDGYQFRFYTATGSPHDGLRNHYIWALHTDRDGRLWVGTESGGLARYDETTDRFQRVPLADQGGEAVCVWSLDDDGAGGLWVGTSRGVAHLQADGKIMPPAAASGRTASSVFAVPNRKVEALLRSRQGTLWIGGADGLATLGPDGVAMPVPLPAGEGPPPQVSHLMLDSAGRIWAGTRHHGAYIVDPVSLRAVAVAAPAGLAGPDGRLEIMAMEEVQPGLVWLATFGKGIIEIEAARMTARSIVRDPRVPGTLDSDLIYGLFRDRSGITWIGTASGLDQFVPSSSAIETIFGGQPSAFELPMDITAIIARPDGSIWFASQNDGIVILGADGKLQRAIAISRVSCLAAGTDGPVYIGTRSGLFAASPSGDQIRKVEIASSRLNAGISSLAVANGDVWVGGVDGDGLWELHPAADGAFVLAHHFDTPALPNGTIHEVRRTHGGALAIGTADGVALLNLGTGAVESIVHDPANPHSIMSGQIVSSLTDFQGRLWVGGDSSGIDVMLGRDPSGRPEFHHITTADGLPDPDINRMIADKNGQIWVSTDNGLAMIDPKSFAVHAYKDADGVAISTYWNGSGERTLAGDLLFGGVGGLTIVQPDAIGTWQYRPRVAVSEIHVGGKLIRDRNRELVVAPNANSLSVDFAALDFSAPNRNRYRYKLAGFDTDYITADALHRLAVYTNLPPSTYTLHLEGTNRDGAWGEPAILKIFVRPAWFQTIFFRVAEIAAFVLLGAGIVQGRTVWLWRRQIYLEGLVQERTAELVSKTKDLMASQQTLREFAYFDTLTSLPNRRSFNEALQDALKAVSAPGLEFVLILIDLDGFKRVNDTLGHDAGDELLVIAASRLRTALRSGDFVARLGGDEFAILLAHMNETDLVTQVCDRVVAGMMAPLEISGQVVKIGASVGVALSPLHGQTAEDLYKHADQALYQAKRSGKGVWRWYAATPLEAA